MTANAAAPNRFVALEGAFNLRDFGGYPTTDGRGVRPGLLYRADSPSRLTGEDRAAVAAMSLGHVVDLRGGSEAEQGTWVSSSSTERHVFEIIDPARDTAAPIETVLFDNEAFTDRYLMRLEVGAGPFASAAGLVARGASEGVLVHCTAGKDRTGILVAALLEALGVPRELIVEDYALSGPAMKNKVAHQLAQPIHGERVLADLPPIAQDAPASVMDGFLRGCDERYGGLVAFFVDNGLAPEDLARFRETMLG
jgi:protein-tyrosine phosphatase